MKTGGGEKAGFCEEEGLNFFQQPARAALGKEGGEGMSRYPPLKAIKRQSWRIQPFSSARREGMKVLYYYMTHADSNSGSIHEVCSKKRW